MASLPPAICSPSADQAHSKDPGVGLATEAFYSAWIEALFAAPPSENLSFPSWAGVAQRRT